LVGFSQFYANKYLPVLRRVTVKCQHAHRFGGGSLPKNILVTGPPGCGKSSVIARAVDLLRSRGLKAGGIICPEVREGGTRIGFRMVDLTSGDEAMLAHVNIRGPRVGKYGVNLQAVDEMSRRAIERAISSADFLVIDEIGPMEVMSEGFRKAVLIALDSPKPLIAAVHMRTAGGFIGEVKSRSDVRLVQVSVENRKNLPDEIAGEVEEAVRGGKYGKKDG